ncbi:L-serine ammonia-lyase, iron-sulfur-dependent, subunit alpha [Vampirovibrio chlorellavorus]|uniref:L-serine ammonia-lyase, iron-sulfur-dependent, subunit alpha n=1 Tax=Vampirovibrio chlorellavorus TaxID=758823 RepID=UPI0026EBAA8D|nr:L-serine ammonia-lyase, iron-sulfur-dependent, subunit alpha [Vampirovibrio chlorellavorus]
MPNFNSFQELLTYCQEHQCGVAEAALRYEEAYSGKQRAEILAGMEAILQQMRDTVTSGIHSTEKSMSGLTGGDARRIMDFMNQPQCFLSPVEMKMIAFGLATLEENSRMKRIVACPTAGGSGSVPAALIAVEQDKNVPPQQTLKGLITAGIIGEITARRMFLSGSAAGCQAEVGVASGMAAGGLVEMMGGTPEQVVHAAAISMQNLMGLVCDPVAGLVEVPCVVRNGLSGVQAAASATMALAGVKSFIPMDQVVEAMAAVGKLMHPSLKETAEGGLAQTPVAKAFTETFKGQQQAP